MSENLTAKFLRQAFQLQADKHYKQAIEALYKALCIEPENIEILSQISHLYYLLNNFERALEYSEKILEINPEHVETLRLIVNIHKFTKKYSKALEVAEKLYDTCPSEENFILCIGLLSECEQHEKILTYIDNSQFNESKNEDLLFLKAYTFLKLGRNDEAGQLLTEITKLYPKNTEAKYYLALIFYNKGYLDEAETLFMSILDEIQSDKTYNYLGLINIEKQQIASAINYFQFAIKIEPQNANYHYNLGTAYSLNGWLAEAETSFRMAISLSPDNLVYNYSLAYLYYQQQNYKKAEEAVQRTLELDKSYSDAIILRALIASENDNIIDAKNRLIELEETEKENDFLYYALAKIYKRFPLYNDAIENLQKALFLKPKSLEYLSELADCYCETGEFNISHDILTKVLFLNQHFIYAHLLMAKINLKQEKYPAALKIVDNAIKLDNSSAEAYKYKAIIFSKQGLKNRSIESAKVAVTLQPGNQEYYELLAKLYFDAQEYNNAFLYYKEASLLDETNVDYLYNAAVSADKNNDFANASLFYSYALRLDPYNNLIIYEYVDLLVRNKKINQALDLLKSKMSSVESKNIAKLLKQKYNEINEEHNTKFSHKLLNFFKH